MIGATYHKVATDEKWESHLMFPGAGGGKILPMLIN
jgi:hypothetical protein